MAGGIRDEVHWWTDHLTQRGRAQREEITDAGFHEAGRTRDETTEGEGREGGSSSSDEGALTRRKAAGRAPRTQTCETFIWVNDTRSLTGWRARHARRNASRAWRCLLRLLMGLRPGLVSGALSM